MIVTLETELQNYILEQEIGRDELTIIYQGRRKSDDGPVAIKVIAPQFTFDDFFVRRFKDITRQTIRLEHPNIVRTYEVNQEGEAIYVVRDMIEARSLADVLLEEGPFSPHRMLEIARQIANALDYAHQKSIMHGDLSAHRVYLAAEDQVIVADFGQTQATLGTSLVKQGFAVGSPEVTAPERVHGQGPSRQSDLYSLGILCYQMLNNAPPFTGTPAAVLHAQVYEQPRPLHTLNPTVSPRISEALGRMLSKGLELRYNTGSEFTRAMQVAIEGTGPMRVAAVSVAEMAPVGSSPSLWRRPWFWLLLMVPFILVLLIIGFLLVSLVSAWLTLQPAMVAPVPAEVVAPAAETVEEVKPAVEEQPQQPMVVLVEATPTVAPLGGELASPTPASSPTNTPIPTATWTPVPIPTPGPPVVAANSPFTNIRLAHAITPEGEPARVGLSFAPGDEPIYLFFDYAEIEPGMTWLHRWTWADTELGVYEDVWPENFFDTGTAWVYYSPTGDGFQPGPYQVTLEIDGQVVATATFVIEPGGL
jgi:hypothetical protein